MERCLNFFSLHSSMESQTTALQPFKRLFILMRLLVVLTLLVSCFLFGLQCISIADNTLEALTQHIIFISLSVIILGGERH
jgi:hypothetical protein